MENSPENLETIQQRTEDPRPQAKRRILRCPINTEYKQYISDSVQCILNNRTSREGRKEYFIRWKNYGAECDQWLAADWVPDHLIELFENNIYEVERILDDRTFQKRIQYLVRWTGFDSIDDNWVFEDDIENDILIQEYEARQRLVESLADDETYEVERIISKQKVGNKLKYLVRWKGYGEDCDSWVMEDDLNCPEEVAKFTEQESQSAVRRLDIRIPSDVNGREFILRGFTLLNPENGLSETQVQQCYDMAVNHYRNVMRTLSNLGRLDDLETGFVNFKSRDYNRYDFQIPKLNFLDYLTNNPGWLDVVSHILGADCRLIHMGCILSLPRSARQKWHCDGDSQMGTILNVFIPLIDMNIENGPTEFLPNSHFPGRLDDPVTYMQTNASFPPEIPLARAGQPLLFDFRLYHRGLANSSDEARPMLYLTYVKAKLSPDDEKAAFMNFSEKRYLKELPEIQHYDSSTKRKRGVS